MERDGRWPEAPGIWKVQLKLMTVRQLTKPEVEGEDVSRLFAEATHTLFHLPSFNRIVSEVFDTEYAVLGAFDKTGLLGICSTHGVKAGALRRLFHAGPRLYEVPYGGWVVRARKLEPELRNHIPLGICDAFEYWSMPGAEEGVLGGQRFSTAVIELTPAIEAIWQKSIDGKRRNMIRKAEKQGVTVVEGGEELVDVFIRRWLLQPTDSQALLSIQKHTIRGCSGSLRLIMKPGCFLQSREKDRWPEFLLSGRNTMPTTG